MSRVSVITGAASGNGRAVASRLLKCGDRVAALDISIDALDRCRAEDWCGHADSLLGLVTDVTDEASINAAIEGVKDRFGRLDVLVNNAGITGSVEATTVHATPVVEFDRVIAVNLRGVFLGCRAALDHQHRFGRWAGRVSRPRRLYGLEGSGHPAQPLDHCRLCPCRHTLRGALSRYDRNAHDSMAARSAAFAQGSSGAHPAERNRLGRGRRVGGSIFGRTGGALLQRFGFGDGWRLRGRVAGKLELCREA
jgi:NAD(P)-dependent dehydrogenase (short-subunit alcohol dehydrogenase family)